jgi:nucleotide-binding universal stress UspA family protein
MYETILHPTDGSEASMAAADHAIELAAENRAALRFLYVVDASTLAADDFSGVLLENLERSGRAALEDLVERAEAAGVDAVTAVETGVPHREILADAEDAGADLIVMGTHGRTGLDRFLLGSVSERVVRTADVPVLVVPPEREGDETADGTAEAGAGEDE